MTGILIDNVDIILRDGLISIGDINVQTVEVVLTASRGEFKEMPTLGGEAIKMLGGTPNSMWCTIVRKQLASIGISVQSLEMIGDEITVKINNDDSNSY